MVILEPIDPFWHYVEQEAEFRLVDARCACGGDVFVLTRRLGQIPVVCALCDGRFPDGALRPWVDAGRKLVRA